MNDQSIHMPDSAIMPPNDKVLTLGDKLLVTDTLGDSMTGEARNDMASRFPMKTERTCLLILVSGTMRLKVSLREFTATDGSAAIIKAGTLIQHAALDDGSQAMMLSFNSHELPAAVAQGHAHEPLMLKLDSSHIAMLKDCYAMLRTIITDPSFMLRREEVAMGCVGLMALIATQGKAAQPEAATHATRRDEIVARFLECVDENYREHRELSFYAAQLGLSLKYMSHVVHELTGRHPSAWIRDHVILDAQAMLRSGRYSVQQVAAALHFPNQSFFGKYFKEATGVSPKKWK